MNKLDESVNKLFLLTITNNWIVIRCLNYENKYYIINSSKYFNLKIIGVPSNQCWKELKENKFDKPDSIN